jgi:hypothetical protein
MQNRKMSWLRLLPFLPVLLTLSGCVQEAGAVQEMRRDDWFYSRLGWMALVAAIVGVLVGLFHLCRLRFLAGELHANGQARRKFGFWLIIMALAGAAWLLVDAWMIFPFDEYASLNFADALFSVFLNYRTLLVLLLGLGVFSLFVAVSTRFFKSDCRCKYAFIPGPKGK